MLHLMVMATLSAATTAIVDVSVIHPGSTHIAKHQNVVVQGDRIVSVDQDPPPRNAGLVNGKGKYLIPGLWDMHVHWYERESFGLFTANGVTGIREMFGSPELLKFRKQVEAGKLLGPRMVVGSPIVDGAQAFWKGSISAGSAEKGRAAVRLIKATGYDFVKVYSFLPPEAYFAILDEAKKVGLPVDGHVPLRVSVTDAARAGQRCAEHLYGLELDSARREGQFRGVIEKASAKGNNAVMDAVWYMDAAIKASHDFEKEAGVFAELKSAEMWQCPTLAVHRASANWGDPKFRADPRVKYIPRRILDGLWKMENWSKEDLASERRRFAKLLSLFGRMHAAGVPVVAGTDVYNPFTFPGFSLHDELELFVLAGMTATEALATATINPARFLGEEKVRGAIKPGMIADMVLLDENPLQNIGNTRRINSVIQRGKFYDRVALDRILRTCEKLAAKRTDKPKTKE